MIFSKYDITKLLINNRYIIYVKIKRILALARNLNFMREY